MEHLIQNQETVLIVSTLIILLTAIFLIVVLTYKFRKYAEYTANTFEHHVETFQNQWKEIKSLQIEVKQLQSFGLSLDRNISQIHETLNKPLYDNGNIVDFTDVDSEKTLTGKILSIHATQNSEPCYYVEVEQGVYFDIKQSQISAWTN